MSTTSTAASTAGDALMMSVYDSYIEKQLLAAIYCFIWFTGVVGNSAVLLAVLFSRKPRSTTNVFVANLAVADLITCLSLPIMVLGLLSPGPEKLLVSQHLCSLQGFVLVVCTGCSMNNITAIAFYRAWITCRRNKPCLIMFLFTPCGLAVMVATIWLIPVIVGFLPIVTIFGTYEYDVNFSTCTFNPTAPGSSIFSNIAVATYYPIQLVITFTCYASIFVTMRKHARRVNLQPLSVVGGAMRLPPQLQKLGNSSSADPLPHTSRRPPRQIMQQFRWNRAVNINMFLVLSCFLVCWSPYSLVSAIIMNKLQMFIPYLGSLLVGNSCMNPLIYTARHPDFKQVCRCILLGRLSKIPMKSAFLRRLLRLRGA